jgi:hypothetical protein
VSDKTPLGRTQELVLAQLGRGWATVPNIAAGVDSASVGAVRSALARLENRRLVESSFWTGGIRYRVTDYGERVLKVHA